MRQQSCRKRPLIRLGCREYLNEEQGATVQPEAGSDEPHSSFSSAMRRDNVGTTEPHAGGKAQQSITGSCTLEGGPITSQLTCYFTGRTTG